MAKLEIRDARNAADFEIQNDNSELLPAMNQRHLLAQIDRVSLTVDSLVKPTFVYVKLDGDSDRAPHAEASIQIPAAVWDAVRKEPAELYDLADVPDAELRKRALERAARWEGLERLLKPYSAPYKALLELKRAYCLATNFGSHFRELQSQRKAQQKLREALEQLRARHRKKARSEK